MPKGLPPALLLGVFLLAGASIGDDENWERLRSMPREQRVFLAEKLREYDRLSSSEQAAIRKLDEQLNAQSAIDRANYRSVLRRYHLWRLTLSEDQKNRLEQASPEERLALVTQFRGVTTSSSRRMTPLFLQIAGPAPIENARRLKAWFDADPAEREAVNKVADIDERKKRLTDLIQKHRVRPIPHLSKEQVDEAWSKIQNDPRLRNAQPWILKRMEGQKEKGMRDRQNLLENYYFIANPPKKVETANLLQFESMMPPGFRLPLDHLPPEEARRRLTILYRLVFPAPEEIPPPRPAAIPPGPGGQAPAPNPGVPKPARPSTPPAGSNF